MKNYALVKKADFTYSGTQVNPEQAVLNELDPAQVKTSLRMKLTQNRQALKSISARKLNEKSTVENQRVPTVLFSGGSWAPVELFVSEFSNWNRQQISVMQAVFDRIEDSSI